MTNSFSVWFNRRANKSTPVTQDFIPLVDSEDKLSIKRVRLQNLKEMIQSSYVSGHGYHDDIQGVLQTALNGSTQYTMRQYRNTGVVMPHIAKTDIFSMVFQFPHRKRLDTPVDSVHLHYIPISSANGNIKINFTWGWTNHETVIADTLPNVGSIEWALQTTDQYKMKIKAIISNLSQPTNETYSSILMVKMQRVTPDGTDWGSGEFALAYMDAHFVSDRLGSYAEYED